MTGCDEPSRSGAVTAIESVSKSLSCVAGGTSASRPCLIHACSLLAMRSRVKLATSASIAVSTAAMIARVSAGLTGMPIDARNRVAIDERHGQIHDQHCERDAVGIAAPGADDVCQHTDAGAVDELAAIARCCRDRIGRDEERSEHARARGLVEQRSSV